MTGLVQVSIDVITMEEALALANGSVQAGVDWLEVGTPLLLAEGLHAVAAFRKNFPDVPIVADLKTMDGAGLEAEMMFKAGANMVVVMVVKMADWLILVARVVVHQVAQLLVLVLLLLL